MQSEAANELIDREDPAPGKPVWSALLFLDDSGKWRPLGLFEMAHDAYAHAINIRTRTKVIPVVPVSIGDL